MGRRPEGRNAMGYAVDGVAMDTLVQNYHRRRYGLPTLSVEEGAADQIPNAFDNYGYSDGKGHGGGSDIQSQRDALACPERLVLSPRGIARGVYTFFPTIAVCLLFCAVVFFVDWIPIPAPPPALDRQSNVSSNASSTHEPDPFVQLIAHSLLRCRSGSADVVLRLGAELAAAAAAEGAPRYQGESSSIVPRGNALHSMIPIRRQGHSY